MSRAATDCRDAAIEYAEWGLRVFPIRPGEKRPLTRHGVKDATVDAAQIEAWWRQWPDANVAVALKESDLLDVECDSAEAEADYGRLVGPDPPVCPTFKAYRGKHRLFSNPGGLPAVKQLGSLEVRGTSANLYSLLPPSRHPKGVRYEWLVPLSEFDAPPPLPETIAVALHNLGGEPLEAGKARRPAEHWERITAGVAEGTRNEDLASFIGALLRTADLDNLTAVYQAATAVNARNRPPLDEKELRRVFESIVQEEKRRRVACEVNPTLADHATMLDDSKLPQRFQGWRLVIVESDPPRYELYAPQFKQAEGQCVVLSAQQLCSGQQIIVQALEQAKYPLTPAFAQQWKKRQRLPDGQYGPSLFEILVHAAETRPAPPEEQRWRIVAELVLENFSRARSIDEGMAPDPKGRPCRMPDGAIVFKVTPLWRDLNWDADKVTRPELCRLLRKVGATDFQCREARGQRFKCLRRQALTALEAAARGDDVANVASI